MIDQLRKGQRSRGDGTQLISVGLKLNVLGLVACGGVVVPGAFLWLVVVACFCLHSGCSVLNAGRVRIRF